MNSLQLIRWRIMLWVASWLDVICGLISIITLTLFRPWWDFQFRAWCQLKHYENK